MRKPHLERFVDFLKRVDMGNQPFQVDEPPGHDLQVVLMVHSGEVESPEHLPLRLALDSALSPIRAAASRNEDEPPSTTEKIESRGSSLVVIHCVDGSVRPQVFRQAENLFADIGLLGVQGDGSSSSSARRRRLSMTSIPMMVSAPK